MGNFSQQEAAVRRLRFPNETVVAIGQGSADYFFHSPMDVSVILTDLRLFIPNDRAIEGAGYVWWEWWGDFAEEPRIENKLLNCKVLEFGAFWALTTSRKLGAAIKENYLRHRFDTPPEVHATGLVEPSRNGGYLRPIRCSGCGCQTGIDGCFTCGRVLDWSPPLDYLAYARAHPEFVFGNVTTVPERMDAGDELTIVVDHAFVAYVEGHPEFTLGVAEWITALREGRAVSAGTNLDFPQLASYSQMNAAYGAWIRLRNLPRANDR